MSKALEPYILALVVDEWKTAPFGTKRQVVNDWAERLGISPETLYRSMPTDRIRRKGDVKIEGIVAAAATIAAIKRRPPEHKGEITTAAAVKIALENGAIAESYADVSISTFDRTMREMGLNRRQRRIQRYQAERPNQLHHVDASSSKNFWVSKALKNGDFVLKLHAGIAGYKNKPVPIRLRPWIYGLTDDYSGVHCARYIAALGESAGDNMDFLSWAWSKNDDSFFFGLPENIKGDQGPMMKSDGAPDWFGRLGIEIDGSIALNKESHGKIERPWRTMWQSFELPFFVESDWKHFEITLSELNRRFMIYQEEYNSRKHRFERTITRRQAWQKISLYGGATALPENALRTVVKRWKRTVDAAGVFPIDNVLYEVKGLHSATVWVYQGIFADMMMVVDERDGRKYEVENFAPNKYGEYTAHTETPHQQAVKAARELDGLTNTLYTEHPVRAANVTQFPTRIKETRPLENPLDLDRMPSMEAALRELQTVSGSILSLEEREVVAELIAQNGLSRKYVVELGLDIGAELLERRYA
ncbi:MAG TPA: hypothetical protein HPP94_08760 [Desulfuromonadales bacterium]|nr:hypothetical protein [Desulfuromonadales bacterium]